MLEFNTGGVIGWPSSPENHQAMVARPGDWRLWAEPETGGEAYIPLGEGKRARSLSILGDVADRFGYQLLRANAARFADGGILAALRAAGPPAAAAVGVPVVQANIAVSSRDARVPMLAAAMREVARLEAQDVLREFHMQQRRGGR